MNRGAHATDPAVNEQTVREQDAVVPVDESLGRPSSQGIGRAIGWTVLGAVLPGLGFLGARRRVLGWGIFAIACLAALAGLAWAWHDPSQAAGLAVQVPWLRAVVWGCIALGLVWVCLVVATHLAVRPRGLTTRQRLAGAAVVGLLSMAVTAPLGIVARYAHDQANLVVNVFGHSGRSQTTPTITGAPADAFAGRRRVNVLLVGLDDTAKRKYSASNSEDADTMIVASIDTETGNTVLVQVPRNMQHARFPEGSALAKAYPEGYQSPDAADNSMTNSIWANVPVVHPELFKNTDHPGADALKLAMQGSLGLQVDYFVALNIDGLQALIDAMGGVSVNINYPYAIGGDHNIGDSSVYGYLKVGPKQHLDGYNAMWYARSRYNDPDGDFGRMARQSCLIKAVVAQANPATMLTRYEAIARAGQNMVQTDIPQSVLPAFVDLAMKVKDARVNRLLFTNGKDGFTSASPDFAMMKARVQRAISGEAVASAAPSATTGTATSPTASATATRSSATAAATGGASATAGASADAADRQDLTDACAYHPVAGASASPTPGG